MPSTAWDVAVLVAKGLYKLLFGNWRALAWFALLVWAAIGLHHVEGQRNDARAQLAAHLAADAKAVADQVTAAKAQTDKMQAGVSVAANTTEKSIGERHERVEAVVAGVAAGTVRVREHLTCPQPAASVPAAAAGAGAVDDGAQRGLSAADVQFLVRFAARCGDVQDERNLGAEYARAVSGQPPAKTLQLAPSTSQPLRHDSVIQATGGHP